MEFFFIRSCGEYTDISYGTMFSRIIKPDWLYSLVFTVGCVMLSIGFASVVI